MGCLALGCGSRVTVMSDGPGEADDPPVAPPDDPPGAPPDEPACGGFDGTVAVTLSDGCAYGAGVMEVQEVVAEPALDGLTIVGDSCSITAAGVGSEVAASLALAQIAVEYRAEPGWLWVSPLQVCPACIPCPCPVPLPVLFAADGPLDAAPALPSGLRPVRVSRGEVSCTAPGEGSDCGQESFELDVTVFDRESGGDVDVAPVTLGSVTVGEGETAVEPATGLIARSLRAHGPSSDCLATSASQAAWLVYRPSGYEL